MLYIPFVHTSRGLPGSKHRQQLAIVREGIVLVVLRGCGGFRSIVLHILHRPFVFRSGKSSPCISLYIHFTNKISE